jgi:hypothetical protein
MSNRELEEKQQELADKNLALQLGISYDDLCQLDWNIDTNESNDGLVYEYIIRFNDNSPKEILNKISDLEEDLSIRLPPSDLDEQ